MKILDCTLRDGGYYTNWDFDSKIVDVYIQAMNVLPIDYIEYNDLGQYFDAVSISSRVHSGKTERYIFEDALIKLNVSPEECMFIDNTEENLVVPANMGMQTILFDNANSFFIEFTQKLSL